MEIIYIIRFTLIFQNVSIKNPSFKSETPLLLLLWKKLFMRKIPRNSLFYYQKNKLFSKNYFKKLFKTYN